MKTKKYYTPNCIKKNMNDVNIDGHNISIFTMPVNPYRE